MTEPKRPELTFRRAQDADVPRMVDLMRTSLGEGTVPRTEAFFRWKHLEGPFGPSPILLAEDGDRLVGLRAFLRWQLRRGERSLRAVRAVDTATHPDYRGRGIFRRLTMGLVEELKTEGVDFVFNTPNDKSGPGYLKMGWRTVGRLPVLLRPRLALALRLLRRSDWGRIDPDEATALERAVDDSRIGGWFGEMAGERGHTERTPAYLRWRYLDVPGVAYGASFDPRSHLLVFRRRLRRGLRELTLCEVVLAPRRGAALAVGRALMSVARGAEVVSMAATSGERVRRWATLAGFIPLSGPVLTSRPLAGPPIEGFDGWLWSLGDLELF